jgi:diguanylate cyclase (GGDEF)-like protein/hemerythrin-like metal-binding protein
VTESAKVLRGFLELVPAPLAVTRASDGAVLHVNEPLRLMLGCPLDESPPAIAWIADVVEAGADALLYEMLKAEGRVTRQELVVRHRGGERLTCMVSINRLHWDADAALLWTLTDVTVLRRLEGEVMQAQSRATDLMQRLSFQDPLTQLSNRALLHDRLNHALKRSRRNGECFALMILDLDGFKLVNDSFGHQAGDQVLRVVADRLSRTLRSVDTVARHGGDEFAVLLERVIGTSEIAPVADKIIAAISAPIEVGENTCQVGTSIGIAMYPVDGTSTDVLVSRADAAMYASKARGKNLFTFSLERRTEPVERQLIAWNGEHVIGIRLLDEQHRVLVDHINRLFSALTSAEETPVLRGLLHELTEYSAHHFTTEESLMDRLGIEDCERHKAEHTSMVFDLRTLRDNFEKVGLFRTLEAVRGFLLNHIQGLDRELAQALSARGVL